MGASGFQWSRNCPNARCRESWERNNRESFVAQYSPDRTALESSRWSNRVWLFRLLTFVLILPPEGGSVSRYDSKHSRPWVSIFTIESLRCIIRCKLCSCYFSNKAAAEVCYAGNYTVANNKFNKFNNRGYIDDGIAELKTTFYSKYNLPIRWIGIRISIEPILQPGRDQPNGPLFLCKYLQVD